MRMCKYEALYMFSTGCEPSARGESELKSQKPLAGLKNGATDGSGIVYLVRLLTRRIMDEKASDSAFRLAAAHLLDICR